jgi:NhaP-type Na+/H+ or K+/H+ antiporter
METRLPPPPFPGPEFETNSIDFLWLPLSGFILAFSCVSVLIKKGLFLSEAFVALGCGVIIGPYAADVLDPFTIGEPGSYITLLLRTSEALLAIQIVTAATTLGSAFWKRRWISWAILVGPITISMWIVTSLLAWGILGLQFWDAVLLGAACSPTDPVLANSIVKGQFAGRFHVFSLSQKPSQLIPFG